MSNRNVNVVTAGRGRAFANAIYRFLENNKTKTSYLYSFKIRQDLYRVLVKEFAL